MKKEQASLMEMFHRRSIGICPFCGNEVNATDFKDRLSMKEFKLSGLCQKCQDKTFKEAK